MVHFQVIQEYKPKRSTPDDLENHVHDPEAEVEQYHKLGVGGLKVPFHEAQPDEANELLKEAVQASPH